eukprot:2552043-Prorocentrum_lima.AAC.1
MPLQIESSPHGVFLSPSPRPLGAASSPAGPAMALGCLRKYHLTPVPRGSCCRPGPTGIARPCKPSTCRQRRLPWRQRTRRSPAGTPIYAGVGGMSRRGSWGATPAAGWD